MAALVVPDPKWMEYKRTHNRNYGSGEDHERFETWKKRVKAIKAHNARYDRGEVDYKLSIDHQADRHSHEIGQRRQGARH
ncbi:hypothetical protein PVAND_013795 [Polypedilum vanderplanki]|uniref:Cathepsin propeptide inhibitor domain-containing protein n=1 Tax=Polypedilum vanderplanki TaxID=319348 RepID=A0A9J6CQG8_POLVA|nr:hypothetical protein PVAND_013795 [Polypedilum vanderplanki]